jgi:hypothetical protein
MKSQWRGAGLTPLAAVLTITAAKGQTKPSYGTVTLAVGVNPSAARIGDLDGDGDKDLAVTGQCFQSAVLRNNGQGSFLSGGAFGSARAPLAINLADFNHDGFPDIAAGSKNNNQIYILLNTGNYNFSNPFAYPAGQTPVTGGPRVIDRSPTPREANSEERSHFTS